MSHFWSIFEITLTKDNNMTIKDVAAEVKEEEGNNKKVEVEEEKSQYWYRHEWRQNVQTFQKAHSRIDATD